MLIYYKGKRREISVRKLGFIGKARGLMFKSKETHNLLFEFKKDTRKELHSFFVFYPFLVLWLDKNNKIVDFKIARPFKMRISPEKSYRKFIELPLNNKNMLLIKLIVGNEKI